MVALATAVWELGTRTLTAFGFTPTFAKTTNITGFNDLSAAEVNTEVDAALSDINLNHLAKDTATWGTEVTKNSIIDQMTSKDSGQTFSRTTDCLEALQENTPTVDTAGIADAVWNEVLHTDHEVSGSASVLLQGASAPSAADVADAVWEEAISGHFSTGTTGAKLNSASSPAGAGAVEWTYTITDSVSALPIADVSVWVSTDLAGTNIVASGTTNAAGLATFWLDSGTYFVWRSKAGVTFTNPDTEVV
jgi:hypothetical protein